MKILIVDDESGIRDKCRRAEGRSEGLPAVAPAVAAPIKPRYLRMATVVFADVRGFTPFTESVPPEESAARLDEMLACFIEAVYAEGGMINKFIGDGAMAVFGAPLPHAEPEAAAARATLRARAAVERLNARSVSAQPLRFGFGINTGLVVAGRLGTDESSEYGVIGAPVNLAARLEEAAGPGQILVGGESASHLDWRFNLAPERSLCLEGIISPVAASELL